MKYKIRFALFFLGMILFQLASNFAHPVTPTIIQELGLPDYMFGLMLAAMLLSNFLFSPFWGKINGRITSRVTLLICCVGYALAQLIFAVATGQGAILLARVLAGVFVGGVFVSYLTYVVNIARPEDQAKYLTYSATIQAVFSAFGYLVGGVLGEFSIQATFLLQSATLAAAGIVFFVVCLPDRTVTQKLSGAQLLRQSNPLRAFLDGRSFLDTTFLLLFALNVLINFGNTGFDQVFNYYLKDQLGFTSSYNGLIKAAVGLISFVSNLTVCIWILKKTDVRVSVTVLSVFCTLAAAGTLIFPQLGLFIAFSVALYAGYSVSLPVLQNMVAQRADPEHKNLVMGFYNATKSLGSILGSLLSGFLYAVSTRLPFAVVAVTYGLSILAAAAYLLRSRTETQSGR